MKQKSQIEIEPTNTLIQRRALGRWALGAGGIFVLAGCGGGALGGEDDNGSKKYEFRAAFDALRSGMGRQDVIDLVGRRPNEESVWALNWTKANGERLFVEFASPKPQSEWNEVTQAEWRSPVPATDILNKRFE